MAPLGKLFIGVIVGAYEGLLDEAYRIFTDEFGEIDIKSAIIDFTYTTYYEKEMGNPLVRQWASFKKFIKRDELAELKNFACAIESRFKLDNKRRINIDPGYITLSRVCLASTKDFAHRIYIGNGIYAELTLVYHKGSYRPLPWTYPDYKANIHVFNAIRNQLLTDIRNSGLATNLFV